MIKKLIVALTTFVILLTSFLGVNAQMSKSEVKKAFTDANYDMLYESYGTALKAWRKLNKQDSLNHNINYKIGYCIIKSGGNKQEAISYLEYAVKSMNKNYDEFSTSEKKAPYSAQRWLAYSYHVDNRIADAIDGYQKYQILTTSKSELAEVAIEIQKCNYAKELIATPVNIITNNLGDSVNSEYADYSPVISADESIISFTSRRDNPEHPKTEEDGRFFEDIYVSYRGDSGWSKARPIGVNINTDDHEATVNLSADGQQLYIYKAQSEENGDIYVSTLNGEVWGVPQKLTTNVNTKYWERHAAVTADGRTLYFTSDKPKGLGGTDIYRCTKLPNGEWSLAQNLGPVINTPADEEGVFLHPDGIHVYFASQGHKNMGGFDIFVCEINEDGSFTEPTNVGYPINSTDDDVYFVVSTDGRRAYYSSAKFGTNASGENTTQVNFGEKDIYVINLVDGDLANVTILKGVIRPGEDEDILDNVQIEVVDANSNDIIPMDVKVNAKTGKFLVILPPGKDYKINYDFQKYGKFNDTINVPKNSGYREIDKEIDLTQPDPMHPVKKSKDLVARDDVYYTLPNTPLDINPFKNDVIKKGKFSSLTIVDSTKFGKNVLNNTNNTIRYTPQNNFTGNDVLKYTFSNTDGAKSNVASAKIIVTNVLAIDDKASTNKNTPVVLDVVSGDKIYKGKIVPSSIKITLNPEHGKVTVDPVTGKITYTPDADYIGEDVFTYSVMDDKGNVSNEARVDMSVLEPVDNNYAKNNKGINVGNCEDKTAAYDKYFKYNKNDIDKSQKEFTAFIEALIPCINKNGSIELNIESSASKVPTKTFTTNENLSTIRLDNAKQSVIKALTAKGIDATKVKFINTKGVVQGPDYNNDFIEKKKEYEKYQYTKITCN